MKKGALVAAGLGALALLAWLAYGYIQPRRQARAVRENLRSARMAVDSCRMRLSREEADFRAYDDRVDSLRQRVRAFEELHPDGVPADSFQVYLETFDRYNEAVPRWEARADSLQQGWEECRELADRHNALADSLRGLLVEIGELPDTAAPGPSARPVPVGGAESTPEARVRPAEPEEWVATEEDWRILRRKVAWARSNGLDTLPVGEAVARLGRTFVGTPYVPHTLEAAGPERLVVNLRALDCVTFVETVLALVHVVRDGPPVDAGGGGGAAAPRAASGPEGMAGGSGGESFGGEDDGGPTAGRAVRSAYRRALTRIRYRGGVLDGYPSRLHYFSEWISDAEEKGLVRSVTRELGGVEDPEPVNFMSEHPGSYRQLADSGVLAAILRIEERLSRTPRVYVPQERIADVAGRIRSGDVIAATSSVPGLDVAHTGIVVRSGGRLHLLHAPLVGDSVQISEETLAQRIAGLEGQDGILVARPVEPK